VVRYDAAFLYFPFSRVFSSAMPLLRARALISSPLPLARMMARFHMMPCHDIYDARHDMIFLRHFSDKMLSDYFYSDYICYFAISILFSPCCLPFL